MTATADRRTEIAAENVKIIKLSNSGRSFGQIALQLGMTRSAVAGRINRMRNPRTPVVRVKKAKPAAATKVVQAKKAAKTPKPVVEKVAKPKILKPFKIHRVSTILALLREAAGGWVSANEMVAVLYPGRTDGGPASVRSIVSQAVSQVEGLGHFIDRRIGRGYRLLDAPPVPIANEILGILKAASPDWVSVRQLAEGVYGVTGARFTVHVDSNVRQHIHHLRTRLPAGNLLETGRNLGYRVVTKGDDADRPWHGYRGWTPDDDRILREDTLAEVPASVTAAKLQRPLGNIYLRRFRTGLTFEARSPEQRETIVELARAGATPARIVRQVGVNIFTVERILKKAGMDVAAAKPRLGRYGYDMPLPAPGQFATRRAAFPSSSRLPPTACFCGGMAER